MSLRLGSDTAVPLAQKFLGETEPAKRGTRRIDDQATFERSVIVREPHIFDFQPTPNALLISPEYLKLRCRVLP